MAWRGVMRYDAAWRCVLFCSVLQCGVVWCDVWYATSLHEDVYFVGGHYRLYCFLVGRAEARVKLCDVWKESEGFTPGVKPFSVSVLTVYPRVERNRPCETVCVRDAWALRNTASFHSQFRFAKV